jgi:hypothetical protein
VSRPKLASDGEVGVPFAPVGSSVSPGLRGFDVSGVDFPAGGLGGLSTLGDSLSVGVFFA